MQVTHENIQPYDVENDAADVYALWQVALGETWPIEQARFQQVLAGPYPQHFVARSGGRVVGFAATLMSRGDSGLQGHLVALFVAPDQQGKGLGKALYEAALAHLQSSGVKTIQLGGHSPRFWCGVPGNLPRAVEFFAHQGWSYAETVYDMIQDLRDYTTPPQIVQRMKDEQISIAPATSTNVTDVLLFESQHFPNWLMHFERNARLGDYQDMLVARDSAGRVVGTLVISSPQSHPRRTDVVWQSLLGWEAGSLGAVGVVEQERGRGIGLALVAYASEILKERGVRTCYIDWLVLTDFYGKLGYKVWRDYRMSKRTIESA